LKIPKKIGNKMKGFFSLFSYTQLGLHVAHRCKRNTSVYTEKMLHLHAKYSGTAVQRYSGSEHDVSRDRRNERTNEAEVFVACAS
jgi:hypothetical protein